MSLRKPHPSPPHGGNDHIAPGFTLVEILLAILILGIVMGTIYAAYTGTFRLARATEEDDDRYAAARVFFMRLAKDVGGLVPYRAGYEFTAQSYTAKDRAFMRLSFRSSAHLAFAEGDIPGGIARIVYEIAEGKNDEVFQLLRRDILMDETSAPTVPWVLGKGEELGKGSFILCDRVHALTFRFYDAEGREYETWDSRSDRPGQKKCAPAMILVRLDLVNPTDGERPLRYTTRIAVPVQKGGS
jgi:prepilin-type N-terminal cleavage/methylation domain-containing protein